MYNQLGYNNGTNIFELGMAKRQILLQQRREFQTKMLEKNYPVNCIIGHSIIVAAVCITLIALEIIMIINKSPLYYIGSGIWVSAYLLFSMSLALLIS